MARAMVVLARRGACSFACSFLLRAFFKASGTVTFSCSRASAWVSSLTRWAAARASVTLAELALVRRVFSPLFGVFFGACVVMGSDLLLASHEAWRQPGVETAGQGVANLRR